MTASADRIRLWRERPAVMVRELFGVCPDVWQDAVLDAFPTHPRVAMTACKGPGKAQPVDTIIPTPSGDRRFGDLKVGDQVFAGDGSITTVTGVYERGVLPVFKVAFVDGASTLACGEHLWKVRGRTERRHDTWSVLSTQQIIERGVREKNGQWSGRHFEIPRQGPALYPTADLPLDPYCLGVWLGDGVRKTGRYATKPEPDIAAKLKSLGFKLSAVEKGVSTIYGATAALREVEVFECYSYQRFVPTAYKLADIWQRQALLCGLMDTDGCCDADGHVTFASTSKQLADDVVWLARSLGGVGYVRDRVKNPWYTGKSGERVDCRPCYTAVLNLPFNPFTVPHRQVRWKDPARTASTVRYMTRKIDAITEAGVAACRCISVAHADKLYLTNDFIVTHNTTVLAWIIWNFLLTRIDPKILCTSVTGDNLSDGLWTELAKWRSKSPVLMEAFEWTSSKVFYKSKPEQWFASARTWPRSGNAQEQANTLAGFHADHALAVLDEAGGIPVAVLAAAEAVLAGGGDQHIVMAGNPTQQDGSLGHAVLNDRHNWFVMEITGDPDDPMRASRVDIEWARKQIAMWGRDNPWVLVNVFGRFPPIGLNTLISPDEVRDAQKRHYRPDQYQSFPSILGVDVARFGDDESVAFRRQGKASFMPNRMRNLDSNQGAAVVGKIAMDHGIDSIQIDATGGYGAGWYDQLHARNWTNALAVHFSGKATQSDRFYNKRAEMIWDMMAWIKDGGALPPVPEMVKGLSTMTYTLKGGRILIEEKDQIKVRLGRSPDLEDALACTFAHSIAPKEAYLPSGARINDLIMTGGSQRPGGPLADLIAQSHVHHHTDTDPFERFDQER